MNTRPLPPERYSNDSQAQRVRRCHKCGGEMRCMSLIELRVNGGYSGRDYTFDCEGCRHSVTELSLARVLFLCSILVPGAGLAGMLVFFGVKMLIQTVTEGPGGNDLSAVIVVLVLFLGLGIPLLLMMLWFAKSTISDWIELRRNPIVR